MLRRETSPYFDKRITSYLHLVEFLNDLNEAQRGAASHVEGPMMVIAGAGSGKTRVLTYRIAHLISKGTDAFSILALTFTNKAAREMKDRIAKVIGDLRSHLADRKRADQLPAQLHHLRHIR